MEVVVEEDMEESEKEGGGGGKDKENELIRLQDKHREDCVNFG